MKSTVVNEYKAQLLVSGASLSQFHLWRRIVMCTAMADFARLMFQPCRETVGDCLWVKSNHSEQKIPPVYCISFLYPLQPLLDQLSRHSASTWLQGGYVFFLMDGICCIDSFWSQWRVFSGVNVWVENLPVWHLPLPLDSLYLCALPEFVCPEGIRLRFYVCELFIFLPWFDLFIVLRKRKHNGSLSISFHISSFLMSLPSRLTHSEFSFHRK